MKQISRIIRIWIPVLLLFVGAPALCHFRAIPHVTAQQKNQLRKLAMNAGRNIQAQRRVLRQSRRDLFRLYMNYRLDEHRIRTDLDKIHVSQVRLLNIHLESQIALRRILTQNQFSVFIGAVEKRHQRHPRAVGKGAFAANLFTDRAINSAGLNPAQRKRMLLLARQMNRRRLIVGRLRQSVDQMIGLYSRYKLDIPAAKKLINKIHLLQLRLSEMNHKRQSELRSIVTEAQFQRLKAAAFGKKRPK